MIKILKKIIKNYIDKTKIIILLRNYFKNLI